MKRSAPTSLPDLGLRLLGIGSGTVRVDEYPGANRFVQTLDAIQALVQYLQRSQAAPANRFRSRVNQPTHQVSPFCYRRR